jgi:DNA repair protein RadC
VKDYVASLGHEANECLLALFVDPYLQLLSVEAIGRGNVSSCEVRLGNILVRGHALGAAGFILVHNHPSGDPRPSVSDIEATKRIASIMRDMEFPLVDHLIIAGEDLMSIGAW